MKYSVIGCMIFFLILPALSTAKDDARGIHTYFDKVIASAKINNSYSQSRTRSITGPRLYRNVVTSVVCVVTEDGHGSGVLISNEGYILTNWHVVKEHESVGVIFIPQTQKEKLQVEDIIQAEVIKTDQVRDLALLQIESIPSYVTSALLGSQSEIEIGQNVFAISHPKGLLWSYTEGVISQVRPDFEWESNDGVTHQVTLIQTQTALAPGSSGAPLFNAKGQLIGICQGSAAPGFNFAIAIEEVREFILG